MTFDPEQNRIPTGLLTVDERAALLAAKHGYEVFSCGRWVNCINPSWIADCAYRAKPAPAPTIIVNGIKVPEPVREALEVGQRYWLADPTDLIPNDFYWDDDRSDRQYLSHGLIHFTEAAAFAHAKAMLAPSMRGDV